MGNLAFTRSSTMGGVFERLVPSPGPADASDLAATSRRRVGDRPWVGVCMVTSLDGAVEVDQRSAALSCPEDAAVVSALRAIADVILVGAGTVRAEGYGPPKRAGQRIGVVTASGDVDTATTLFTSGAGFLILPEEGPPSPEGIDVVRAGTATVDMALALSRLDDVVGTPTFAHVEGGPGLNGSLLDADCVDELNLTISPRLAGGDSSRIITRADPVVRDYDLVQLARSGPFLFGRWVRPVAR